MRAHAELPPVSGSYPPPDGRLPTWSSPVRHVSGPKATPFDLHALGTPPALILSQDQTLHHSAGLPPARVRPDPRQGLPRRAMPRPRPPLGLVRFSVHTAPGPARAGCPARPAPATVWPCFVFHTRTRSRVPRCPLLQRPPSPRPRAYGCPTSPWGAAITRPELITPHGIAAASHRTPNPSSRSVATKAYPSTSALRRQECHHPRARRSEVLPPAAHVVYSPPPSRARAIS